jgi:hypothetical protein
MAIGRISGDQRQVGRCFHGACAEAVAYGPAMSSLTFSCVSTRRTHEGREGKIAALAYRDLTERIIGLASKSIAWPGRKCWDRSTGLSGF